MSNAIVAEVPGKTELADWFALARAAYADAMRPVIADDPRAQELADAHMGPAHRTDDPELIAAYYWEGIAARKLPLPPISWPAWATSGEVQAEAWGGGVVEVTVHAQDVRDDAAILYQQRFEFDPVKESFKVGVSAVRITTPDADDEIWISLEHLPIMTAACAAAAHALTDNAGVAA